jgi:quinol monooxygenase YgiN
MTIIMWAQMDMDPDHAHRIIAEAKSLIDDALAEPGCEAYTWSHDPFVPGRVNVFERWTSEEALAAHFKNPAYTDMGKQLRSAGPIVAASRKFRVDAEGPIYDETRTPRADFFDLAS